jgi:hypothetical protein
MPGPEPPASCGQRFISIYGRQWRPGDEDLNRGIDEIYDLAIALSYRAGFVPQDMHGEELYVSQIESMENVLRKLLPIHQNYEIITAANARFTSNNKIIEPLRWRGNDAVPTPVGPAWFKSLDETGEGEEACGYVMEANYGGARRKITYTNLAAGT